MTLLGGTSSTVGNILLTEKNLELLGGDQLTLRNFRGDQFEILKHFTYRKKLVIFRGGPVKKNTLYVFLTSKIDKDV